MKNKIIKTILTILMAISILPIMATTAHADGWDGKGTKGDPWQIGSPDAAAVKAWLTQDYDGNITLHISGLGEMQDFEDKTPWEDYTHDITRLDIRKDITNIGANAFNSFNKLTSVSVPSGVTHIGEGAFGFCSSLTNISLPSSLTSISDKVFWYCLALEQITIPSNVTEIGNSLFYQCTSLKTVTFKPGADNKTLTFAESTFTDIDKDKKLAYTSESAKLYEGETVFDAGSDLYQFNGKTLTWRTSEYPLWVGGVQVKRANKNDILNGTENTGTAIFTPAGAGENPSPATLTLQETVISEGHYISDEESYGIYYYGKDELNIILESENIVGVDPYYGFTYGIYSSEAPKVTFSGSGSLDVTAGDGGIDTGIFVNGDLEINETEVTSSVSGYFSNAIYAKNLLINKSTVTSTASEEYSRGIYASNSVTINGSTVTSTASGKNTNGIYAKNSEIESGVVTAGGENAAIYGKVENAISGKGWADVEHTDEPTPIDISAQGRELEFKYVEFKDHTHSFTYSSDGATITATCVNTDGKCDLPDGKATLTIAAPLHTTYGDEKDASAVITDEYGIQGDATVSYYKANTDDTRGEALSEAPTDAGKYWAEITLGEGENSATAHVVYTIAKAQLTDVSVEQNGTLTYTGSAQRPEVTTVAAAKGDQKVTFTYSKTQDGEYTPTVPSITSVNESGTFYYKASAPNHEDASGSFEVTMEKAASSAAAVKANHRTYDANEEPLVTVTGEPTGGTMNYAIGEDSITAPTNWSDAIPSAKNADTYYVWYKAVGDDNHSDTDPVPLEVKIDKASLTIEAINQNIKVGGIVPDLTNPVLNTHYRVTGLLEDDRFKSPNMSYRKEGSAANPDPSIAGTYRIMISGGSAGDNYTINYKEAVLTISEKNHQTITAEDMTVTYGDTDKSVIATVTVPETGGGTISYAVKEGSQDYIDVDLSTGKLTIKKTGTATVVVTAAETEEYAKATKEVLITINKAASIAATVNANNRTYDASEEPLVTVTGETTGGTMNYVLGTDAKNAPTEGWSQDIPEASNAGAYYVWYKVIGDSNHKDSEEVCVEVKIEKASLTVEAINQNIKVGGIVPDLTNPVLNTHYRVTGLLEDDRFESPNMSYRKEGSAANPDSSKANTFEIKISGGSAGENYSIIYKDAILTISDKKTQTITAEDVTVTYGDTDKSVSATVTEPASGGGKITFAVKDDSRSYINIDSDTGVLSIRSVPSDNKAYVLVTAAETEEYAKASIEVLITINKANSSVSKAPEAISNLRYTGTAQELVNKGQAKGGTMNYALGDNSETEPAEWSNTIPSASDARTYYVWYMVKGNNNYNNSAVFGPIEISIGKADTKGEVTEENYPTSNEPLTYNASAQKLLNDPKEYPQDYDTILYSTDGGTSWSDKAEATDAGIHQIRFKFTSPNYEDLKGPIMGVEIKKATGSVTSQDQKPAPLEDLKYSESGTELVRAPKELPEGYDKVQYSMDDGKSWSDSIPKGQGGDYTVKVKYIGDKNHNDFIGDYELKATVQNSYTANDTSWVKGSSDGGLIIYKAKVQDEQTYGKFIGVKVDNDNEFLDPSKYDKAKGSVRITLKPSYLETLSIGRHTLNACFSDGAIVPAYFTIRERIKPTTPDYVIPKTGVEQ